MDDEDDVDERNIVLTGFMGTGKSTVGRVLATQLEYAFVDTDEIIEQRHGPIATIFEHRGEEAFRTIEREVAAELATHVRTVIATGGRMLLDPANIAALTRRGRVFCLTATPDEILARVTTDAARVDRPLLAGPGTARTINDLLARRREGYGQFQQIATDGRSPQSIADEIATQWRRSGSASGPSSSGG